MYRLHVALLTFLFAASCTPMERTAAAAYAPTLAATGTPTTPAPTPTPTSPPTPTQVGGASGRLIFDLQKTDFAPLFPDLPGDLNIFVGYLNGGDITPVTKGLRGNNYLQDISPDGRSVLIASASDITFKTDRHAALYVIRLDSSDSEPVKISEGISEQAAVSPSKRGTASIAKWIDDTRLVYIGGGDNGFGIYTVNRDGSDAVNIYSGISGGPGRKPAGLMGLDASRVYWFSEISTSLGGNRSEVKDLPWWSNLDGSGQGPLEYQGKQVVTAPFFFPMVVSADGTHAAWMEPATHTFHHNYLHIAPLSNLDAASAIDAMSSWPTLLWEPDSSNLLVFDNGGVFGPTDTNSDLYGFYTVSKSAPWAIRNAHAGAIMNQLTDNTWLGEISPDGRNVLVYQQQGTTWWAHIEVLNLDTKAFSQALPGLAPHDVHWLP